MNLGVGGLLKEHWGEDCPCLAVEFKYRQAFSRIADYTFKYLKVSTASTGCILYMYLSTQQNEAAPSTDEGPEMQLLLATLSGINLPSRYCMYVFIWLLNLLNYPHLRSALKYIFQKNLIWNFDIKSCKTCLQVLKQFGHQNSSFSALSLTCWSKPLTQQTQDIGEASRCLNCVD